MKLFESGEGEDLECVKAVNMVASEVQHLKVEKLALAERAQLSEEVVAEVQFFEQGHVEFAYSLKADYLVVAW